MLLYIMCVLTSGNSCCAHDASEFTSSKTVTSTDRDAVGGIRLQSSNTRRCLRSTEEKRGRRKFVSNYNIVTGDKTEIVYWCFPSDSEAGRVK